MKKYSADYFEKKYKILSERLLQKEGFLSAVKQTRAALRSPFNTVLDLANSPSGLHWLDDVRTVGYGN